MLDLHALSSGGSAAALTDIATILLGGDGATAAGVPIGANAKLINWGAMTTIADTISRLRLLSPDHVDYQNGEDFILGASSLIGCMNVDTDMDYKKGRRIIAMLQNTGAANNMGFLVDKYGSSKVPSAPLKDRVVISQLFAGALAAITWRAQAFAPAILPPTGRYALLGFWINCITNYALVRFVHSSFGGYKPGLPCKDDISTAAARAVLPPSNPVYANPGYQFLVLKDVPEFQITENGTGLTIEASAITTDTPIITLNLSKVV